MRTIPVAQILVVCLLAASTAAAPFDAVPLPAVWRFRLDPADAGVKKGWFAPDLNDQAWKTISTHQWEGWNKQGFGKDKGYAWYRLTWKAPATLNRKHVYLFFCGVGDAAQVYINGQAVGEHPFVPEGEKQPSWIAPFHLDVTSKLRFGRTNQFTLRVRNVTGEAPGIWKPVYVFAGDKPLSRDEMRDRTRKLNRQVLAARNPRVLYDVWTTYAYDPVFPHSTPPDGKAAIVATEAPAAQARSFAKVVRLRGAVGEYVAAAVHIRNRGAEPLGIRLDFLPVRHEKLGLQMRMDRVEVRFVDYILTTLKKLVPDPLPRTDDANGLRIAPGTTGTFFVLIDTDGMPAGAWKGKVHLTPLRVGPGLDIPFQLDVAPVVLPERAPLWLNVWSNPPSAAWMPDGRGPNEPYYALMRRTGINVVQSHCRPVALFNDAGEMVGINTERFDRSLARYGFTNRDFLVLGHFSGCVSSMEEHFARPKNKDAWKQNFAKYVKMVARHIRLNHDVPYERWGLYLTDENIGPFFVTLAKLVRKGDPKVQIWANRLEDLETTKKAAPYIDVLVPYAPWLSPKGRGLGKNADSEKLMLDRGVPWWAYFHAWWRGDQKTAFPRAMPNAPHSLLRMHAWFAWKLKLDGFGYWLYIPENFIKAYSGNPTSAVPGIPHTNTSFIYIGHDGPITSRRLEAYREGWEDYKLMWTVRKAAKLDGQNPATVERALTHIPVAVDAILGNSDKAGVLLKWRDTLLDDATELCAAAPLKVDISDVAVTRSSIRITCSASRPIRVWAWVDRGPDDYGYVKPSGESSAPIVTIDNLVPGETCKITLVIAGPEGQQRVITRKITTRGWGS